MIEPRRAPLAVRLHVEPLPPSTVPADLATALAALRDEVRRPVLFDSAGGEPCRTSLLALDPLPLPGPRTLAELDELGARVSWSGDRPPGPFAGGFAGALAYDLGVDGEDLALPPDPWGWPAIVGGVYADFLVRDEAADTTWLVLGETAGGEPVSARARRLRAALARGPLRRPFRAVGALRRHVSEDEYTERIRRVLALIAEGELYQANLSHRLGRDVEGDPLDLYLRLRARHPGPWSGFARFEQGALLSASPELLLEADPDGDGLVATTRPIKGTAARSPDPDEDRRRAAALLASPKDLAELAMIVDLERNDLGRLALADGVSVPAFPRLESYATVHHLVADVRARFGPGVGALDVLRAVFPGGSITGAPKLASMSAIAALEGEGRGFAFGSLLHLDHRGHLRANLLIRSPLWRPRPERGPRAGEVSLRVGGGITWGSEPGAEIAEAAAKAAALLAALEEA